MCYLAVVTISNSTCSQQCSFLQTTHAFGAHFLPCTHMYSWVGCHLVPETLFLLPCTPLPHVLLPLAYREKRVMLDCGIHPGLQGEGSLPYLSAEDLDTIDVALITHFHLDHCAAVPYLLQKTVFKVIVLLSFQIHRAVP